MKQLPCIYPCMKYLTEGQKAHDADCLKRAMDSIVYSVDKGAVYRTNKKEEIRHTVAQFPLESKEKKIVIGDLYGSGEMAKRYLDDSAYMTCDNIILYEFEMNNKIKPALSYFANNINSKNGKVEMIPVYNNVAWFAKTHPEVRFNVFWLDYCNELTAWNGYNEDNSTERDLLLLSNLMNEESVLAITGRLTSRSKGSQAQCESFINDLVIKYFPSASLLYPPMVYTNNNARYAVYIYKLHPNHLK